VVSDLFGIIAGTGQRKLDRLPRRPLSHPVNVCVRRQDNFTRQAAVDYLRLLYARWPHIRNPYLFVSSQTAYTDASVTIGWMQPLLRDLPATARQLREDRLLEEAAASGGDPSHLCAPFNVGPQTGLRYVRPLWPAVETTATSGNRVAPRRACPPVTRPLEAGDNPAHG
jgi:hypothetical protein